ncbi:hypothetical protein E0Z10_g10032 [Xylaria hypoxylon]|uniref:Hcy-binding domain-containing protein n=1 Tax=Xylaria hypoxylon TaxID=37992 RepID=A0A4Z0YM05_9PEZI|nr:hypothetical protein E0Z10_g10032 [Xylaria hypoxylon]
MDRIRILDGGLGTSLVDKFGVTFDKTTPLWSGSLLFHGQDTLYTCQRDFVEAGVDVLLTATYQASIEGFARTKTTQHPDGIPKSEIPSYIDRAVVIARHAAKGDKNVKIALSLGPYGACMVPSQEYSGKYDDEHDTEESLYQWHLKRLSLFISKESVLEGVQMLAFETVPRVDEIRAVRRAMSTCGITLPFWISTVYPGDSSRLPDGSSMVQVVESTLASEGQGQMPWGIGINCTSVDKLAGLVAAMKLEIENQVSMQETCPTPALVLYPDGVNGMVHNSSTNTWELSVDARAVEHAKVFFTSQTMVACQPYTDIESQSSWMRQLVRLAREVHIEKTFSSVLVGGCCKTSAADIKALRDNLVP